MKLPETIRGIQDTFGLNYRTFLSTNPKTEKNEVTTRILHLVPADLSGSNLCQGAGNCRRICLHFAGNPAYFNSKQRARMRRAKLYNEAPQFFLNFLVLAIAYEYHNNGGQLMAVRLNGTSDLPYEDLAFNLSAKVSEFIARRFGITIAPGHYDNILQAFQDLSIKFYDYTKIERDWQKCRALGYHLTFSFDGYGNKRNHKICREAWQNGLNVAAAFNVKKGRDLPAEVYSNLLGIEAPVHDGDLSDYRPNDPMGRIIGLRFKIPRKATFSGSDVLRFCMC